MEQVYLIFTALIFAYNMPNTMLKMKGGHVAREYPTSTILSTSRELTGMLVLLLDDA